jgi:hypothetical protein
MKEFFLKNSENNIENNKLRTLRPKKEKMRENN